MILRYERIQEISTLPPSKQKDRLEGYQGIVIKADQIRNSDGFTKTLKIIKVKPKGFRHIEFDGDFEGVEEKRVKDLLLAFLARPAGEWTFREIAASPVQYHSRLQRTVKIHDLKALPQLFQEVSSLLGSHGIRDFSMASTAVTRQSLQSLMESGSGITNLNLSGSRLNLGCIEVLKDIANYGVLTVLTLKRCMLNDEATASALDIGCRRTQLKIDLTENRGGKNTLEKIGNIIQTKTQERIRLVGSLCRMFFHTKNRTEIQVDVDERLEETKEMKNKSFESSASLVKDRPGSSGVSTSIASAIPPTKTQVKVHAKTERWDFELRRNDAELFCLFDRDSNMEDSYPSILNSVEVLKKRPIDLPSSEDIICQLICEEFNSLNQTKKGLAANLRKWRMEVVTFDIREADGRCEFKLTVEDQAYQFHLEPTRKGTPKGNTHQPDNAQRAGCYVNQLHGLVNVNNGPQQKTAGFVNKGVAEVNNTGTALHVTGNQGISTQKQK